jgi:hypothetical protein
LEAVHIEIHDCYYGKKHDILSVSKSVAWYQKYVHINASLARRYIQEPGGRSRRYLHLGRPTILRLRDINLFVYCPPCRKQCKKWWPVISGLIHWVYPLHLYQSVYKGGRSEETAMHHVITYVQEENWEFTLQYS